jgi:hypothetical protein
MESLIIFITLHSFFFATWGSFLKAPLHNFLRKPSGLGQEFIDHIKNSYIAVHLRDKDGYLPIHIACMNKCNIDIIQALLEIYPESASERDTKYNKLPLQYLIDEKNVDTECLVALLNLYPLSAGVKDKTGKLPLHHAASAISQSEFVIRSLLEAYPPGAGITDENGKLSITYALEKNAPNSIITLLLKAYPKGAHALLVKAVEGKLWQEAEKIIKSYPEATGVRSKKGKLLPLGVAISKKAPLSLVIALLNADPSSAAAGKELSGGCYFYCNCHCYLYRYCCCCFYYTYCYD